jgi:hypothetical protein
VDLVDEDQEFLHQWRPQYIGENIHYNLMDLVMSVQEIAGGKVGIYESSKIKFDPARDYIILEPLSEEDLRIAYRMTQSTNIADQDPPLTHPKSACGYVVDRCEFCQAVSDGAHEYVDELRSMPLEWGVDLLEEFEASLSELDEALETCEQTPPQPD